MTEWHGWGRGESALHVGPLPGRKSICLYSIVGSVMNVHAYFRSEYEAQLALRLLDLFIPVMEFRP